MVYDSLSDHINIELNKKTFLEEINSGRREIYLSKDTKLSVSSLKLIGVVKATNKEDLESTLDQLRVSAVVLDIPLPERGLIKIATPSVPVSAPPKRGRPRKKDV